MDVTVFSSAACGKCVVTKRHLKERGIGFTEVRVDKNPEVEKLVRSADVGVQLPIVMAFRTEDDEVPDFWSDYHPSFVDSLLDPSVPIPQPV